MAAALRADILVVQYVVGRAAVEPERFKHSPANHRVYRVGHRVPCRGIVTEQLRTAVFDLVDREPSLLVR